MSLAGSNSIAPVAHQPVATGVDAQVMAASATQGVPGAQGSTAASAVNVTVNQASSPTVIVNQNTKSKATAIILALFLGGLGIDCFYVGNTGLGILALITFAISDILWIFAIGWVLWIGLGIWALIRAIMYACSDKPPFRNNVTVVK